MKIHFVVVLEFPRSRNATVLEMHFDSRIQKKVK